MVFITTKDCEIKISENGIVQCSYCFRLLTSAYFQPIISCLGSVRTVSRKSEQAGNITVKLMNSSFKSRTETLRAFWLALILSHLVLAGLWKYQEIIRPNMLWTIPFLSPFRLVGFFFSVVKNNYCIHIWLQPYPVKSLPHFLCMDTSGRQNSPLR